MCCIKMAHLSTLPPDPPYEVLFLTSMSTQLEGLLPAAHSLHFAPSAEIYDVNECTTITMTYLSNEGMRQISSLGQ